MKGLSELIGLNNLISETIHVKPTMTLCTDTSSCKRMILRHGTGKVEHLSVKQLWSQEVVRFHDIQVRKVTRASDPADMLTHSVGFAIAEQQLARFNASRGKLKTDFLCPRQLLVSRVLRSKCPGCIIHPKEPLEQSGIPGCRILKHASGVALQGSKRERG